MAKKKKDSTPEEKLRALYALQIIDSRIDKIRQVRGELPLEVQDLEDEIAGLTIRVDKIQGEIDELNGLITDKKNTISTAKESIKKYEDQQNKVRNNREFDSLTKEIEYQGLEMQLAEKRIKEYKAQIEHKNEVLAESTANLNNRQTALDAKRTELNEITQETRKEEEVLIDQSEKAAEIVDDRLLTAYQRIRQASKNGLAVVAVERGASGGSFIKIPPQRQMDIAARKKIIVDEHSGRILVDQELAEEETEKMNKLLDKLLA